MSDAFVRYPAVSGGGGGGDVTGTATPAVDGSGYRPIPVYTDDTGKIIGAKGLDGGGRQQFGVNSAGTALKVGTIVVDGFNAYITDTFGVGFQFGGVGLYLISDLITFPATKNLGVASGGHYNFLEASANRLYLGFAHGDAFTTGAAGSITVKAGTPLRLNATSTVIADSSANDWLTFNESLQTLAINGTRALTLDPNYIAFDMNVFGRSNRGLGTANNEAWPFEAIGGNTLALGYSAGDALPTYVLGQIFVKPGINLTVSADKALFSAGIGVGNSATATTPGSVVRKIEIFNASGTSLGFIPVYDTIT